MQRIMTVHTKKNPVIPKMGVCDPHIHVFRGRLWLYATHDETPDAGCFRMRDWQIWSTEDCLTWRFENTVHPEDFFMGASDRCWAVDCAEKNGTYYYYFSDGSERTGVAVAERPGGPFRDALGKPLLDGAVTPTREYDPSVFKDDDGLYYLVFGGPAWAYGEGCGYYIARLGDDMISLAETPKKIELDHDGDDKASLNKINGRYYLSYGGFYAVSDRVYGPYRFLGHTGSTIDHSSFCEWNGQLFQAITVLDQYGEYRSSGLCYVHVRENGELVTDPLIVEYGVGQYDADWNRIEAEWFMRGKNVKKVENADHFGFSVEAETEAALAFPHIRNTGNKIGLALHYDLVGGAAAVEAREADETGKLLGVFELQDPSPVFRWQNRRVAWLKFKERPTETTDLCLVLKPAPGAALRLDCFRFFEEKTDNP